MSGASLVSCAISLSLTLGDFYTLCCRPERLREPGYKNISKEPPGLHAGIARESSGNPQCWKSLMFPNFQSLVQNCCSFAYEGLTLLNRNMESWSRSPVRYLPFKSAKLLEVDLRPLLKPVILHQRQLVGWSHLMAGYSGVLWPGSLLLSRHFAFTEAPPRKRCIELAAGRFALPSIALAASLRCAWMLATDLPGVVELELPQKYTEWTGRRNLEVGALDLCDPTARLGHFDLIVSSEGALQTPCGIQALLTLSTRDTELHLVLRGDAGEVLKQRFLLRNAFLEESRVDLAGKLQPSPPVPAMEYVVWRRTLGPRTCWDEDFTYAECCQEATGLCFDQIHTRRECCGSQEKWPRKQCELC